MLARHARRSSRDSSSCGTKVPPKHLLVQSQKGQEVGAPGWLSWVGRTALSVLQLV